MLAISRQNLIKELLQENKSVTIADLAVRMNVTRETIRRDLKEMEEAGIIQRVHGGAVLSEAEGQFRYLDLTADTGLHHETVG